ncbi:hypothetical protein [Ferrimonas balearica]|uniref:hypothetical protein n=1 Tax=Ferrimonas balearica TaxID=44012 RepID=UPI001C993FDC|nr:hypothetical protein [Ferrimonas balearica]MBY5991311.1 hypothetical protein [Ferrimonas balearica]
MTLTLLSVLCLLQVFASCLTQPVHLDDVLHPMGEQVAHQHSADHRFGPAPMGAADATVGGEHEHSLHAHLPCHPPAEHHFDMGKPDTGLILARTPNRPDRRLAPPLPPPNA